MHMYYQKQILTQHADVFSHYSMLHDLDHILVDIGQDSSTSVASGGIERQHTQRTAHAYVE